MAIELGRATQRTLRDATASLKRAGIDQPRREALRIGAAIARMSDAEFVLALRDQSTDIAADAWLSAIERRAEGAPLAHVVGQSGFRRLTISCDKRALIPRPETEGLVDLALAHARSGRVIDVATGTGCVALALRSEGSYQHVVASDISPGALALARENQRATRLKVELVRSDLLRAFSEGGFDLVVSNPPYLTISEHEALDPAVREHEPFDALVSGRDGLAHTRALLAQARRAVRPGGWLVVEVDARRGSASARCAQDLGWCDVKVLPDLFGRDRYLLARQGRGDD